MLYRVRHKTAYAYSEPVVLCQNQARLTPRSEGQQERLRFRLHVEPEPVASSRWTDMFGNVVDYFAVEAPHDLLEVTADAVVERRRTTVPAAESTPAWEVVWDALAQAATPESRVAVQFCYASPFIQDMALVRDYALASFPAGRPILAGGLDLTRRIFTDFKFSPAATAVSTPTRDVFAQRRGVCQDFAHLQITCFRAIGLAARYVSGYLLTDSPPGEKKLVGADASHAWVSLFCPDAGWIDLDPTNNVIPQDRHVTIGWGRDYGDVCPIKGVFTGGGRQSITVGVDVTPIAPDDVAEWDLLDSRL